MRDAVVAVAVYYCVAVCCCLCCVVVVEFLLSCWCVVCVVVELFVVGGELLFVFLVVSRLSCLLSYVEVICYIVVC